MGVGVMRLFLKKVFLEPDFSNYPFHFVRNAREEQEEEWMRGCKRSRVARSSIRIDVTTCFRRLVQEDLCFEHEKLRHVFQRVCENSVPRTGRGTRRIDFDGDFSCLLWVHTKVHTWHQEWVSEKVSLLDDNQEQQAKYEHFSAHITVRTPKILSNQVTCVFGALFHCGPSSHVSVRDLIRFIITWGCLLLLDKAKSK